MKKYIVVELNTYYPLEADNIYSFDTANEVGSFMWGRGIGKHLIYKNGKLAESAHICSEVKELSEYLKNFIQ